MDFGMALKYLKQGEKMARAGWNGIEAGKIMYVEIQKPDLGSKMNHPYIYLVSGKKKEPYTLIPWVASQTDILSKDWLVV